MRISDKLKQAVKTGKTAQENVEKASYGMLIHPSNINLSPEPEDNQPPELTIEPPEPQEPDYFVFAYRGGLSREYMPKAQTEGSAGLDVRCAEYKTIPPNTGALIDTGVKLMRCVPELYFQLVLRSGFRVNNQVSSLGTGIIDSDYRDFIKVLVFNHGTKPLELMPMTRIAQLIPTRNLTPEFGGRYKADKGQTRNGGFGSTG